MYFLFKMGIFHCHVCLPEGTIFFWKHPYIDDCFPDIHQVLVPCPHILGLCHHSTCQAVAFHGVLKQWGDGEWTSELDKEADWWVRIVESDILNIFKLWSSFANIQFWKIRMLFLDH